MKRSIKLLGISLVFGMGTIASPLLAQNPPSSSGSQMGGMSGMMNMMGRTSRIMDHCEKMMGIATDENGSGRPNEQWRKNAPARGDRG